MRSGLTCIREQIAVFPGGHGFVVFEAFQRVNRGLMVFVREYRTGKNRSRFGKIGAQSQGEIAGTIS